MKNRTGKENRKKSLHVKKIKFQGSETNESGYDEENTCNDDELNDLYPTSTENICLGSGEFGNV